ncbi:MAG: hypothetical protein RLZZ292_3095 [Bacteroidota bacterium]|jgi:hypothetical protein
MKIVNLDLRDKYIQFSIILKIKNKKKCCNLKITAFLVSKCK